MVRGWRLAEFLIAQIRGGNRSLVVTRHGRYFADGGERE